MDQRKPIVKRKSTHLPHWEQEGGQVFITFRLADSLPRQTVEELKAERDALERKLTQENWLDSDEEWSRLKTLQSRRVEDLLDAGTGSCVLRRDDIAEVMKDVLLFFEGQRYRILAWCIMPNHVHVVLTLLAEWPLAKVLHSWKSFSAKRINTLLGKSGAL
jgi:hypothetical protein